MRQGRRCSRGSRGGAARETFKCGILHGEFHGLSQCRRWAQEQGGLEAIVALAPAVAAVAAVRLVKLASGEVDTGTSVCARMSNMRNKEAAHSIRHSQNGLATSLAQDMSEYESSVDFRTQTAAFVVASAQHQQR